MNRKVVYVTSQCPFGIGEIYAIRELISLMEEGVDLFIIPRTGSGKIVNKNANKLISKTISTPFINFPIVFSVIRKLITEPLNFIAILRWLIGQSNSFTDFVKGMVVLPKSIFIGNQLKEKGIEHIHAFSSTSVAVVAYILANELKIPWSVTFHSSWTIDENHRRSVYSHVKSVSFVRAISNEVSNVLKEFIEPQLSVRIIVLHLGVKCDDLNGDNLIRRNDFIIVSSGGPWSFKGIDISLLAARKILDKGIKNFKWTIYGDGPLMKNILKMSEDLHLNENVHIAGQIDNKDLLNQYKNGEVDLGVLNSIKRDGIQEGIPFSLMEAMVYAIPVIATDCGGTKELVDGESGVLLKQGDPESTAIAIIGFMSNKEKRIQQGLKGREKILKEFDSKIIAKQLLNLFFKI